MMRNRPQDPKTARLDRINDKFQDRKNVIPAPVQHGITIGVVVDTADPQEMGRLRVRCDTLGDKDLTIDRIPWSRYFSPFGGIATVKKQGKASTTAYGHWNIPKLGAEVAVFCIDGNASNRGWFACGFPLQTAATMPHGALSDNGNTPLIRDAKGAPIEPLSTGFNKSFKEGITVNHEFLTRGSDRNVQRVNESVRLSRSNEFVSQGDETLSKYRHSPGYQESQDYQGKDSQIYSWVTPGFHAFSMEDHDDNSRMRLRTSKGHQVLLDDTNERLYIAVAGGNCWFEMDENGDVDVYSSRRISMHAAKDINFTSDESIRMHAKKGIHMYSQADIRMTAKANWDVRVEGAMRVRVNGNINIQTAAKYNCLAGSTYRASSIGAMHIKSGEGYRETAPRIDMNGPPAISASLSVPNSTLWTNRVPDHESWARTTMANSANNTSHTPEVKYDSPLVGIVNGGETIPRGKHWRR